MKNPFYVDQLEAKFTAAAAAVRAYCQANADRETVTVAELAALPAVAALKVAGELPEGYREEILQRVRAGV